MIDIAAVTEFLGWCTLINTGLLLYSTIMMVFFKNFAMRIHGKLFNLGQESLETSYFNFLGNFKLAIIIFNLVPYIALKLMA